MGTSFIEYKGFGFWSRDRNIQDWVTALIAEMRMLTAPEPWQDELIESWQHEVQVDGGCISLRLDEWFADELRRDLVRRVAAQAVRRATEDAKRTGELFVALLAGDLRTNVRSPIDYL